jgi:hypothetical protein
MLMPDDTPKIIVDDDWKEQARKEKEEVDRQTREEEDLGPIPEASFAELVQMIALQATMGLGGLRDQSGQPLPPNLPYAKHYIDLLELLQAKTNNNLDAQEQAFLNGMLHELRMVFVELSQAAVQPPESK